MLLSEFDSTIVKNYMYTNRDSIPIVDSILITNQLYGRFDIIINRYYPNNMQYLELLYDFNNISNPLDVKIGDIIDVPNINYVIDELTSLNIFTTDEVPGVNSSMDSTTNNVSVTNTESKTINIPKLKIEQKKVSYDTNTGIITY